MSKRLRELLAEACSIAEGACDCQFDCDCRKADRKRLHEIRDEVGIVRISWLVIEDPDGEVNRMTSWAGGDTETFVVTGVPIEVWKNCPSSFDAPDGARVHKIPEGERPIDAARRLGGVVVTNFKSKT